MGTKKPEKRISFPQQLAQMTKDLLYKIAKKLQIPGRSRMTKPELVQTLKRQKKKVEPVLKKVAKEAENPTVRLQPQKKNRGTAMTTDSNIIELTRNHAMTSSHETKPAEPSKPETSGVWHGEEGPELPRHYNRTLLRAMPRDPNWVYIYWEISDATRQQLIRDKGEWIFEVSTPVLRVYDGNGDIVQEIPVLLDAMNWYLRLASSRNYQFELGIKTGEEFISLARSNSVALATAEPSSVTDEEWAIVEERFYEMLEAAAMGGFQSMGGSAGLQPHLFRHRIRFPWTFPAFHDLPSSHFASSWGGASGQVVKK